MARTNTLKGRQLSRWSALAIACAAVAASVALEQVTGISGVAGTGVVAALLYISVLTISSVAVEGRRRAVIVCATSDKSSMERAKAAYVATAIAEYFRDQGKKVLFLMDSVTRFARAQREIGLAGPQPLAGACSGQVDRRQDREDRKATRVRPHAQLRAVRAGRHRARQGCTLVGHPHAPAAARDRIPHRGRADGRAGSARIRRGGRARRELGDPRRRPAAALTCPAAGREVPRIAGAL